MKNLIKNFLQKRKTKKLYASLQKRIEELKKENYEFIMETKLIPYVIDLELSKSGLLLTLEEAEEQAHAMFVMGKITGSIDEFNSMKGV